MTKNGEGIGQSHGRHHALEHAGEDKEDMVGPDGKASNERPKRIPAQTNDKHFLMAKVVTETTTHEDEGAYGQAVAGDEPREITRVGKVIPVANNMDDIDGLAQSELIREHGHANSSGEKNLPGGRKRIGDVDVLLSLRFGHILGGSFEGKVSHSCSTLDIGRGKLTFWAVQ